MDIFEKGIEETENENDIETIETALKTKNYTETFKLIIRGRKLSYLLFFTYISYKCIRRI